MLGFLTKLFGSLLGGWKKWLAVGLGAALVAGYVVLLHLRLEAADSARRLAELQRDQAVAAAEANAAAFERAKADAAKAVNALEAERAASVARARQIASLKSEIARARQTADDGPVAPVLRHTLDRLRGGSGRDPDPDRAATGPGKPADLRGRTRGTRG